MKFADDTLVLYLSEWSSSVTNAIDFKELGRSLSKLLRTVVRILPDEVENDLAEFQAARTSKVNRRRSSSEVDNMQSNDRESKSRRLTRDTNNLHDTTQRLRIKLDNTRCKKQCFKKASRAAEFIYLSLQKGWDPGIPISAIGGKDPHAINSQNEKRKSREYKFSERSSITRNVYLHISMIFNIIRTLTS